MARGDAAGRGHRRRVRLGSWGEPILFVGRRPRRGDPHRVLRARAGHAGGGVVRVRERREPPVPTRELAHDLGVDAARPARGRVPRPGCGGSSGRDAGRARRGGGGPASRVGGRTRHREGEPHRGDGSARRGGGWPRRGVDGLRETPRARRRRRSRRNRHPRRRRCDGGRTRRRRVRGRAVRARPVPRRERRRVPRGSGRRARARRAVAGALRLALGAAAANAALPGAGTLDASRVADLAARADVREF